MNPAMLVAIILTIGGILYSILFFVLLIRQRRRELATRKKYEQDMAELEQEKALFPTYTTDEERIAAINRIMRWKE